ncbi:MAG: GTP cyclohydrolase I FolE2 [Candidatus Hodarchaeota archaeon]
MKKDTQDQAPTVPLSLDEVGLTDFKTQISITRGTKLYRYITTINVVINLPSSKKGVHMSRFVESISEVLSGEIHTHYSLEQMSIHVLSKLNELHDFENASLTLNFTFFTNRTTPISQRLSVENYNAILTTWWHQGQIIHELTLGTYGNTACPHALSQNPEGHTHTQRVYAELSLKGKTEEIPDMEEISKIIDRSFSSPTFSLLKAEDEQWLIDRMWKNPLFVEDVTRNLLEFALNQFKERDLEIRAKSVSQESIHKHNIMSSGRIVLRNDHMHEMRNQG